MDKKEQWADSILESTNGMKRAKPNDDLFAKITAQLPENKTVKLVPTERLFWVAAAACVLIAVNIYTLSFNQKSEVPSYDNTQLINDYSLYK